MLYEHKSHSSISPIHLPFENLLNIFPRIDWENIRIYILYGLMQAFLNTADTIVLLIRSMNPTDFLVRHTHDKEYIDIKFGAKFKCKRVCIICLPIWIHISLLTKWKRVLLKFVVVYTSSLDDIWFMRNYNFNITILKGDKRMIIEIYFEVCLISSKVELNVFLWNGLGYQWKKIRYIKTVHFTFEFFLKSMFQLFIKR